MCDTDLPKKYFLPDDTDLPEKVKLTKVFLFRVYLTTGSLELFHRVQESIVVYQCQHLAQNMENMLIQNISHHFSLDVKAPSNLLANQADMTMSSGKFQKFFTLVFFNYLRFFDLDVKLMEFGTLAIFVVRVQYVKILEDLQMVHRLL